MPDSVDASEQMVAGWTRKLQETAARYQALAEHMQGQTVTERSKDGAVEVTVDAKGLLKNLVIAEGAGGKRMSEVSAEVMRLVQRAQSRIPELLQQAMTETAGSQDQTAGLIVREAMGTFPAPPPEEPPVPDPARVRQFLPEDAEEPPRQTPPSPPIPPSAGRPRRAQTDDEDDDFGGPILS